MTGTLRQLTATMMCCAGLMALTPAQAATSNGAKTIYMALWRGCEAACEGFKEGIRQSGIDAVFIERNAAHDGSKLAGFVAEIRQVKPDLVLTWGTSVTLGIAGTLKDKENPRYIHDIPIVYMVVADAVSSGIVKSFAETGRSNITGTHNRVPEAVNVNAIRRYYPAFKRLGMLFSPTEKNSVVKVNEMQALSQRLGFELLALEIDADATGQPDALSIPAKMKALKQGGVDFVYVGSSSFIERNGDTFTRAALEVGLPVLSPYERLVTEASALLSVSARYDAVGRLAARQAIKILSDGVNAGELPILEMEQFAFVVNMETARQLKLFPPLDLLQIAETVH